MDIQSANEFDNMKPNKGSVENFPIADLVALETVVNILIRKGICTPEELFQAEQQRRQEKQQHKRIPSLVQTTRPELDFDNNHRHKKHKSSWLKRKMSKKRWTRKVGRMIFGWEWKKVRLGKDNQSVDTTL